MKVWQADGNVLDSGQVRAAARITPNTWAPPKTAVWSNTIHSNQDSVPCHCEGCVLPANLYIRLFLSRLPAQQLPSFFFKIHFNWRLITLQLCSGFAIHCHESATGVHVFPLLTLPSHVPPHPIRLGHTGAPAPSTLSHASNNFHLSIFHVYGSPLSGPSSQWSKSITLWIWEHPQSSQTRFLGGRLPKPWLGTDPACLYVSETDPQSWSSTPHGTAPLFLDHWIALTGRFWTPEWALYASTHPWDQPLLSFPEAQTPVSRGPGDIQYNSWEAGAAAAHHGGGGEDAGGGVGAADRWDLQVLQSEALVRHLPHRRRPPPLPTSPSASPSQRRGGIRAEPERGPLPVTLLSNQRWPTV